MSIRNLGYVFRPRSVAVVGASKTPRSIGATVLHNLVAGKFDGAILPVNPKYRELAGITPLNAVLARGTRELVGEALADNQRVIGLARRFGAALTHSEPGIVALRIDVRSVSGRLHDIRAPIMVTVTAMGCVRRSR